MARYHGLYQEGVAVLRSCVVDRNTRTIHITKKTSAIHIHRDLADLFDDEDWIVELQPTSRIHDDLIEFNVYRSFFDEKPWKLTGKHNIVRGMIVERT